MDVLYTVFDRGRDGDNGDLRISLRSLAKYAVNIDNVIVAGKPPEWLSDSVMKVRIPPLAVRGYRYDTMMDGIVKAITMGAVSGEFLYAASDAVISSVTDMNEFPYLCRREKIMSVEDHVRNCKGGAVITRHKVALSDTRRLLERNRYDAIDFSGHFITRMDTKDLDEAVRLWLDDPHGEFGYDAPSLFSNIMMSRIRKDVMVVDTAKIDGEMVRMASELTEKCIFEV